VIAVDLPGHGSSEGPALETIEMMADWVVQVLDDRSVQRASIVGHSMGSLVALDTAARYPDRVRSIAMVCVSFPLRVNEALLSAAEAGSHDAVEMLTYWGHSRWAAMGGSDTPGIWMTGAHMRLLERARPETISVDLRACGAYDAGLTAADALQIPALFLMGARDVMTPVRGADKLVEHVPSADTVVFEGAGHALLAERPDQVLDELIRVV
jgi:pimeloyl-ACP methyl ester carboxylesterase